MISLLNQTSIIFNTKPSYAFRFESNIIIIWNKNLHHSSNNTAQKFTIRCFATIAGLMALLFPETLGELLPDTIEDAAR